MGREKLGEWKVERDCAVLKIPFKSLGPEPSLTLRQIDAPAERVTTYMCVSGVYSHGRMGMCPLFLGNGGTWYLYFAEIR